MDFTVRTLKEKEIALSLEGKFRGKTVSKTKKKP